MKETLIGDETVLTFNDGTTVHIADTKLMLDNELCSFVLTEAETRAIYEELHRRFG